MIPLRPYQAKLDTDITQAQQQGARNVLAVCPTGGGKTVNMAEKFRQHQGPSAGIAHRAELVSQMALALARCGIYHRIIGPDSLVRNCVRVQMDELGRSFYNTAAYTAVAGVDTLINRDANQQWFRDVGLWQTDEAHHVLADNKWGTACNMFPNARGIGWTATPGRADGYGLGRDADGLMDVMVMGPPMRWLIEQRYLTEYRIFAPPSDLDLSGVTLSAGGDFSPPKLREATHKSHIVGDIVKHYQRIAPGKLGVTFAVDVDHAKEICAGYRAAGVPAEVVTASTPDTLRASILRRFRGRQILQLVNVDLFGEGFDLPAIEVVSMGRATASFNLFAQQFGRALRLLEGKTHGIIIDHVGNTLRHGLPDRLRSWTLGRRPRKSSNQGVGDIPVRNCPDCTAVYERIFRACPYCGFIPVPADRTAPDQVDGDLAELDPAALAALRGEVERIDGPAQLPWGAGAGVQMAVSKRHSERQQAQAVLRGWMDHWGWYRTAMGDDAATIQRRFFHTFGIDVMSARALGRPEAEALAARVYAAIGS